MTLVQPLLSAADVHLRFGSTVALDGVSLQVRPGEVLALVGPSGSGKSTLLHVLAGILRPDRGEVVYRGQRLDDQSDEHRTRTRLSDFGFLFQFGSLVPELTALENAALPLRLAGQHRRTAEATAGEWLAQLGVADCAGKRPGEMSGGQGQRVAAARALVAGPRVLFCDEPTGALDSYNGELVMDELIGAARQQGTTVLIVTHEDRVAAYADRDVTVRDGRLTSPVPA